MKSLFAACVLGLACAACCAQSLPADPGVYVSDGSRWIKLERANTAGYKTGGAGKVLLMGGAGSVKSYAIYRGHSAPTAVSSKRPTFLIVGNSTTEARDVVIVRLDQKKNDRELQISSFNAYTGGGMRYADRDVAEVTTKADGADLIVTPAADLPPGQYIIFPGSETPVPAGYGGYDLAIAPGKE